MTPSLETDRLILREHALEDFPAFAAIWGDHDVVRHIGGKPLSREEAWVKFARETGDWVLQGFGFWLVEEKSSGKMIGDVGFSDFRRDMKPSLEGKLEFGWVLAASAHGKGYATEAMRAVMAWAGSYFPDREMCCIIDPGNAASIRVAEKLGFQPALPSVYKGAEIVVYEKRV